MALGTMRSRVLALLRYNLAHGLTAMEISKILQVKLSSVSSLLKKMCDKGELLRMNHCGPRGGHFYWFNDDQR